MARPFRIGCPGALYRDLERVGLRLVTQYLAKKWELEFQLQVQHYRPCWAKVLPCSQDPDT